MRRVTLDAPFTAGMVTDVPAHRIGPQASAFAQDGFSPSGMFMQRKGWAYDGTTADVAANLVGVYRNKFVLADVTRTMTSGNGRIYIHNPSSAGTEVVGSGSLDYLPRCVYRDELLFCATNGLNPVRRYSGASAESILLSGTQTFTNGEATVTGGTFSPPQPGMFFRIRSSAAGNRYTYRIRVLNGATNAATLEGIRAGATVSATTSFINGVDSAFPAVAVYDAGTATISAGTATGYGTRWTKIPTSTAGTALLVIPPTGSAALGATIGTPASDTSWSVSMSDQATKSAYQVLAPMPFKDVAAHKESLWGTGVAQYPNRVYVGPPGWNLSFPPGFELPFDPTDDTTSPNANDFLMEYRDVPSPFDGDPNVAILPSPNPLLVLKRHAVYGIYGQPGLGLTTELIADGVGCIDIRSAQSFDEGQFFASEQGIMWYVGGQLRDLTAGKINREWRALVRDFDYGTSDYCSIGLASGHLVVHITTGGGVTQRTYLCDLRDQSLQSRITNVRPRYMFTSRIAGEKEKLFAVQDIDQGRVLDLAPMLDGSGTAKDGDGTSPRLQAYTTSALGRADGIEGLTRLIDLDVHANVYDAGAAGSTQMAVSVVSGGGVSNQADSTATLTDINSDAVDRIDRHPRRVSRTGRFHQVRFDVDTLGTNTSATKVEVAQVVATVRDARRRA